MEYYVTFNFIFPWLLGAEFSPGEKLALYFISFLSKLLIKLVLRAPPIPRWFAGCSNTAPFCQCSEVQFVHWLVEWGRGVYVPPTPTLYCYIPKLRGNTFPQFISFSPKQWCSPARPSPAVAQIPSLKSELRHQVQGHYFIQYWILTFWMILSVSSIAPTHNSCPNGLMFVSWVKGLLWSP